MRFLWSAFTAALSVRLRSWKTWLFALLLPALVWGLLAASPREERSAPVQVGVALPEEGAEAFWALLEERSGVVVRFVPADEDTIAGKVASGQWDCGLALGEDFDRRLAEADTKGLVTLITGDGSTVYPLVRETAAACLAELLSPAIAREYLLEAGIAGEDPAAAEARLTETLPEDSRVRVTLTTLDGRALDALALADGTLENLLYGLIAVVLLIWAMFAAVDMGRWLEEPFARRTLALRHPAAALVPRAAAAAVPALGASALALWPLGGGIGEFAALAAYLAALSGLALLAARIGPVWRAFPVLAPAAPALCLVASPILFDPAALFPGAAPALRWLPVALYLRARSGGWTAGLALLLWGTAAVLLALPERRRRKGSPPVGDAA